MIEAGRDKQTPYLFDVCSHSRSDRQRHSVRQAVLYILLLLLRSPAISLGFTIFR